MLLSPTDVMKKGLKYCGVHCFKTSAAANTKKFHKHYGSSPLDLANMWYDLTTTDIPGAQLEQSDKSENGFKMFMVAHHFLWTYPKNASQLASRFGICERYSRGEPLWKWIKKIAALKAKKIVWDDSLNDANTQIFVISVDGIDFRMWEKKHPTLPINTKDCSRKFNHGAVKYELAVSIFRPKCVWINGPFRGGKHDMTIFREDGLKAKMLFTQSKIANADRGYATSRADEVGILATPNQMDPEALRNFKS
jgi:hypothetical protein